MFGIFGGKADPNDELDPYKASDYLKRGKFDEALRRADLILDATPHVALSWRFKGECLFCLERFPESIDCFRRAEEIGGKGTEDIFLRRAEALHESGRTGEAHMVLNEFLESESGEAELIEKCRTLLEKLN